MASGESVPVHTTVTNAGPGGISGTQVALTAPDGWTVSPTTPQPAGTIAAGNSATQAWTVTAPQGSGDATAAVAATVRFTNAATGWGTVRSARVAPWLLSRHVGHPGKPSLNPVV